MSVVNIEVCNSHAVSAYKYINLYGYEYDKDRIRIGWIRSVCYSTKCISSLSLYSLSKQLAEYADWENTGEASTGGGARGIAALGTPHRAAAAGFTLGAPAVDRGGKTFKTMWPFLGGFVLLVLTVLTIGFRGGIRCGSTSCVNVLV